MRSIALYFQVHQPFRLRTYRFFDIGADHYYYDDYVNKRIVRRIAHNCYLPANEVLLALINEFGSKFKVAFSITGMALEQFERYAPEVIESFRKLASTGNVEFLAETYSHSLASIEQPEEFKRQVEAHSVLIKKLFGQTPQVFRNTELVYSNSIAGQVYEMGYRAMITEGARQTLGWKSPNFLYCSAKYQRMKILLRNYQLSDDVAFRFSNPEWSEWPITAEKFTQWLDAVDPKQEFVNLFMDYETFGEHQKAESGIFGFLRAMPEYLIKTGKWKFRTPSELVEEYQPVASIDVPHPISWADEERDITAWLGNAMQEEAFSSLYKVAPIMAKCKDQDLLTDWRYLQASDHFYYMCTKWFSDGAVHHYFNPYGSPYDAFLNYMNVLSDFLIRVKEYETAHGNVSLGKTLSPSQKIPVEAPDGTPKDKKVKTGKRGRPRKETDSKPVANARRGRPKKEKDAVVTDVPKRRGRPRKIQETIGNAVPAKRGRPRKVTVDGEVTIASKKTRKSKKSAKAKSETPARRGRPRKIKEVAENVAPAKRGRPRKVKEAGEVTQGAKKAPKVKKSAKAKSETPARRGRPRKIKEVDENVAPAKRGRPRKVKEAGEVTQGAKKAPKVKKSAKAKSETPARRGRPRKVKEVAENVSPAKRGRPRKVKEVGEVTQAAKKSRKAKKTTKAKTETPARRGRPRKVKEAGEVTQAAKKSRKAKKTTKAKTETPARRGRPRKIKEVAENAVAIRRGRPRKVKDSDAEGTIAPKIPKAKPAAEKRTGEAKRPVRSAKSVTADAEKVASPPKKAKKQKGKRPSRKAKPNS